MAHSFGIHHLKIKTKLSVLIISLLLVLFTILVLVMYYDQSRRLIASNDARMNSHLSDLVDMFDLHIKDKQEVVDISLEIVAQFFSQKSEIELQDSVKIDYLVLREKSKTPEKVTVSTWKLGEDTLQFNQQVVDSLREITQSYISILQKTPGGYLRIASNLPRPNGEKAVGTFLNPQSAVIPYLEQQRNFHGRAFIAGAWYITAYQPLTIDGALVGAVSVAVPEKELKLLRAKFYQKKYLESGFPYVMDGQGTIMIHPNQKLEGYNIPSVDPTFFNFAVKNKKGKYRYLSTGEIYRWQYFQYYEPYDLFISITLPESEFLLEPLARIRNLLIVTFLVAIVVGVLINNYLVAKITQPINRIVEAIKKMSEGQPIDKLEKKSDDEVGEITDSLNQLIEGFDDYTAFAQEIGHHNFDTHFNPLSQEDVLGNSLLQMRDNLKRADEQDRRRSWISEGLAKFSEILRKNHDDLYKLAGDVLANLIQYVQANQGGIFILDNQKPEDPQLEMIACYAYDRHKFLKKKFSVEEGLVGQVYLEGEKIYLSDIPENYIRITSGLGEANPGHLLIVPLRANDQILGVMELASFYAFEDYKIEFVEQLSESIASTLASVKTNQVTRHYLKEMQDANERLQQQDEEMRQNMEELQATQEDARRKEVEIKKLLAESKNKEEKLEENIRAMENYQVELEQQKEQVEKIRDQEKLRADETIRQQRITMEELLMKSREREKELKSYIQELEAKMKENGQEVNSGS